MSPCIPVKALACTPTPALFRQRICDKGLEEHTDQPQIFIWFPVSPEPLQPTGLKGTSAPVLDPTVHFRR